MPSIPCPHCRADNDVTSSSSPFFCKACHAIVDPSGTLRQAPTSVPAAAAAPREPLDTPDVAGAAPSFAPPTSSINYHAPSGPGAGFSLGGSRETGLLIAIVAALIVGAALAWLGAYVLRVPLLYAFIAGWAIRRALALGAGGGTPDRGVFGGVLLAAMAVGTTALARYGEYMANAERESRHYGQIYGPSADVAIAKSRETADNIRAMSSDADGRATTSTGRSFSVKDAIEELATARATGVIPSDPYGIHLLAQTGHDGVGGHIRLVLREGEDVRFLASASGFHVPAQGAALLWLLEAVIAIVTAFGRID